QNVLAQLNVRRGPVEEQVGGGHVVSAVQAPRVLVQHLRGRLDVFLSRGSDDGHAGTSSSSVSGRFERSVSSRSGSGSGCSSSRLRQTVRRPSSRAGAMSWKRLAATWTCRSRSAVVAS